MWCEWNESKVMHWPLALSKVIKEKMRNVIYRRLRSSNRFLLFLILLCFFWILYAIKVELDIQRQQTDKDYLRGKIIALSKEYVRLVAKERKDETLDIDGQTTGECTPWGIHGRNLSEHVTKCQISIIRFVSQYHVKAAMPSTSNRLDKTY